MSRNEQFADQAEDLKAVRKSLAELFTKSSPEEVLGGILGDVAQAFAHVCEVEQVAIKESHSKTIG